VLTGQLYMPNFDAGLIFPCSTCPVTSRILFEKLMPCAFRFLVDDYTHD